MLGPVDYLLWIAGLVLQVYVVVCLVKQKSFLRYIPLNLYMIAATLVTVLGNATWHRYGFTSIEYRYFYYYSESLLIILLYFTIMDFYQHLFREMGLSHLIRAGAAILLVATAFFSYGVVHQNKDHLTGDFAIELGQNLNFVGLVLTYLLWGAVVKLREARTRLVQLVLALGVYFSATAGVYSLRNLFPTLDLSVLRWVTPFFGVWLPLAWAYTFTKVSEDARLMPAEMAVKAQ
jgi:hypothetical protein